MRSIRRSSFVLAIAAVVAAVGVSAALAAGLSTGTASVPVGGIPAAVSATAKCPAGEKVASGGFDSPGFNPNFATGPSVVPYSSFKASKTSWTAAAKNQSTVPGTLNVFAYCAPGVGKVKTRTASVSVAPGFAVNTATAKCPSGQKVLAGGTNSPGFSTPGARVFPFSSYKSGSNKWVASAVNTNLSTQAGILQVFAYCANFTGVQKKSKSVNIAAGRSAGSAVAKCPKGKIVVAGGFKSPTFVSTGSAILPYSSRKSGGRGWTASAFNDGASTTAGLFRAFAYCLKV